MILQWLKNLIASWIGLVPEERIVVRFGARPDNKRLAAILNCDEFWFFLNECELAMRTVPGDDKEKIAQSYRYEGVVAVKEMAKKLTGRDDETVFDGGSMSIGLDDKSLLREYYGQNSKSQAA